MRRGFRLPKDLISRELAIDNRNNLQADKAMCKASKVLERNFTRKDDPS